MPGGTISYHESSRFTSDSRIGILLLAGIYGTIAINADDKVVSTVVEEGGAQINGIPSGGERLGIVALIDLSEVGHGDPIACGGRDSFVGVSHVDSDLGGIETRVNTLALEGDSGDGATNRDGAKVIGSVDSLRPGLSLGVAKRR